MSTTGGTHETTIAKWVGSTLIVKRTLSEWNVVGPDAWDNPWLHTTRTWAERYDITDLEIRLNREYLREASGPWALPGVASPNLYLDYEVTDYRIDLLESLGGPTAANDPILIAAVLDLGPAPPLPT